jgi:hypothetical protein
MRLGALAPLPERVALGVWAARCRAVSWALPRCSALPAIEAALMLWEAIAPL